MLVAQEREGHIGDFLGDIVGLRKRALKVWKAVDIQPQPTPRSSVGRLYSAYDSEWWVFNSRRERETSEPVIVKVRFERLYNALNHLLAHESSINWASHVPYELAGSQVRNSRIGIGLEL